MQAPKPDEISQSLPIPEYKMGWIIGKRGTYVNQLSKKSGATIVISDTTSREYGTVWKYVQITGTGRAVDRAKKLLHIRLERLEPRDGTTSASATADCKDSVEGEDEGEKTDEESPVNRKPAQEVGKSSPKAKSFEP